MPNFDSGRATNLGGLNIQQRRGSDLAGIRFADNRDAPTSANDLVLYRRSGGLYFWNGSTEYNLLAAVAGSVGDLNAVYENGGSITVDNGAIVLTDATTGALDTLRITTSGAKSGDALEFLFTGASTGRGIHLDMDQAIAATGILIDSGGTARTGADIAFTDDSTGAHSVLDLNKSGAGATVGFDYTESYNGSSTSFALRVTLDDTDGIDTTALQIARGTGIRTVPAIDINETSTGSANVIDIDVSGVYTGDVLNIVTSAAATGNMIFINLDSAVAGTALHIEGSGARTQPMIELATDATGAAHMVEIILTGAISGNIFDISCDTTSTGDVLNVDMNAAVGGRFLFLDAGGGARTANLITVTYDATGNLDFLEVNDSNTGTGHIFDINVSGAGSGNVLDIVYGAVADTGDAISIDLGATATGAQALVITSGVMTRTTTLINIDENGAASGNTIDIDIGAVTYTGNVLDINLGATATGGQAIVIASGAMTRTVALIGIADAGTPSGAMFDIDSTGARTGIVFDIDDTAITTGNIFDYATNSASTGTIFNINMTNAVGATLNSYTLAGIRTVDANIITHTASGAVDIVFINDGGTSSGHVFDINMTAASTGNVLDIVMSGTKVAGHALHVDLGTDLAGNAVLIDAAGVRTAPIIYIANTASDAGTDDHVIFINQTGLLDSNLIQLTFATLASTGNAIQINMGTNLAGSALTLVGTGVRTDDLIQIDDDSTGNSHIFDINLTGIYTGNVLDINFSVAAATSSAIMIAMGTNVAGQAIEMTSAGTGVWGEGCGIDITHSGNLVAGANLIDIVSTGSPSATSHLVSLQQTTGAGVAGSYVLYLNATGANVEGLKVDAGAVVFDETLTVTGAGTFSSTLGVTGAITTNAETINAGIQDVAAGGTSTALVLTETVFTIGSDVGGDTFTIANGTAGQIMYIICHDATGTSTITPATTNGTWTSVTFNALNDSVILMYTSLGWTIIGGNSYAIV